jgi:hypothetical protein
MGWWSDDKSDAEDVQNAQDRLTHEATRATGGWLTGHIDRDERDQRQSEIDAQARGGTIVRR